MLLDDGIDILIFFLNLAQLSLNFFDIGLNSGIIVDLHQMLADREPKGEYFLIIVLIFLLDGFLASDPEQCFLPSHDQLLPGEFKLIDVELIPVEEDRKNIKIFRLSTGYFFQFLEVVFASVRLV